MGKSCYTCRYVTYHDCYKFGCSHRESALYGQHVSLKYVDEIVCSRYEGVVHTNPFRCSHCKSQLRLQSDDILSSGPRVYVRCTGCNARGPGRPTAQKAIAAWIEFVAKPLPCATCKHLWRWGVGLKPNQRATVFCGMGDDSITFDDWQFQIGDENCLLYCKRWEPKEEDTGAG